MSECLIECKDIFGGHVSLFSGAYITFSILQKLLCVVKLFIDVPEENSSTELSIPSGKVITIHQN